MRIEPRLAVGSVLIACAFGCERQEPELEGRPAPVGEPAEPSGAALRTGVTSWTDAIAQARCDREQRCGNIGEDQDFASREACLASIRSEWRHDLNAFDCPGGVNEEALNECLDEVRNEDCGQPFDTLGRIVACRSGDICEHTAP